MAWSNSYRSNHHILATRTAAIRSVSCAYSRLSRILCRSWVVCVRSHTSVGLYPVVRRANCYSGPNATFGFLRRGPGRPWWLLCGTLVGPPFPSHAVCTEAIGDSKNSRKANIEVWECGDNIWSFDDSDTKCRTTYDGCQRHV